MSLTTYLGELEQAAHAASTAEEVYRREIAQRVRALEQARAFAFRRLNLMRTVTGAVVGYEEEAEALQAGSVAFMRELEWTGATEAQRQALEQFRPVVQAAWNLSRAPEGEGDMAAVERELTAFERWFAESRDGPFLSVMEREVVELPLVEI
ncbi:MAG: hypothetical protein ACTHLY_16160 [Pseudolabrys sp.]